MPGVTRAKKAAQEWGELTPRWVEGSADESPKKPSTGAKTHKRAAPEVELGLGSERGEQTRQKQRWSKPLWLLYSSYCRRSGTA